MPSKELIEKVAKAMCEQDGAKWNAQNFLQTASGDEPEQQREYWRDKAQAAISTILAALQDPNAEMIKALWSANASRGWPEAAKTCWQSVLAASALGEQSDRTEIVSGDGAIWDETEPNSQFFQRREQSE